MRPMTRTPPDFSSPRPPATANDRLVGTSVNSAPTASHSERIDGGAGNDRIDCVQINPAGGVATTPP
jgi:hypothetical protein